jgi:hypothetical protein
MLKIHGCLHLAGIGCPGIIIIEDSESQEAND